MKMIKLCVAVMRICGGGVCVWGGLGVGGVGGVGGGRTQT